VGRPPRFASRLYQRPRSHGSKIAIASRRQQPSNAHKMGRFEPGLAPGTSARSISVTRAFGDKTSRVCGQQRTTNRDRSRADSEPVGFLRSAGLLTEVCWRGRIKLMRRNPCRFMPRKTSMPRLRPERGKVDRRDLGGEICRAPNMGRTPAFLGAILRGANCRRDSGG